MTGTALASALLALFAPENDQLRREVHERFTGERDPRGISTVLIEEDEANRGIVAGSSLDRDVARMNVEQLRHGGFLRGRTRIIARLSIAGNQRVTA